MTENRGLSRMLLHLVIAWLVVTFTPLRAVHALPPTYFIPAMRTVDAESFLGPVAPAAVVYPQGARSSHSTPLIPLLPWGLRFTADYLVALENDRDWGMIEIVRIDTPKGETWFVLDSRLDGTQVVGLPSNNPEAEALASLFPSPVYDAGLVVKRTSVARNEKIEASYLRQDGSRVAFEMIVDPAPMAQTFRNGNGMNHSERSALAVIDLESFRMASKFRFIDGSSRRALTMAGVEIAGLLVQTAAGLMAGEAEQRDDLLERRSATPKRPPVESRLIASPGNDPNSLVLFERNFLQTTEYAFELRGESREFAELREIRVRQNLAGGETAPVLAIRFNPALPDFRYRFQSSQPQARVESRVTFSVAGQAPYGSAVLGIEPGDRPESHRLTVRGEYPTWVKARPMHLTLEASGNRKARLESRILVPGGTPFSESAAEPGPALSRLEALQAFSFAWEKRPHRLSSLRVRIPGTSSKIDPGIAQLGGGTWANGSAASDVAHSKITTVLLEGADFHRVSTPELPLLQPNPNAGNLDARVEAVHRMEIRFPTDRLAGVSAPVVFVNGFEFRAGPAHEQTGLTFAGTDFDIVDVAVRDARTLIVEVALRQHFSAVPDRVQDFANYSGVGRLHLAVALPRRGSEDRFEQIQQFDETLKKEAPSLVFPQDPVRPDCQEERSIEPSVFTGLKFQVNDPGIFSGRYVRKLQASTSPGDAFPLFSNEGEVTRSTRYDIARTSLGVHVALDEVRGSFRCFSPPSQ